MGETCFSARFSSFSLRDPLKEVVVLGLLSERHVLPLPACGPFHGKGTDLGIGLD